MNTALLSALHEIENQKGVPFNIIVEVLEGSLLAAYEGREGAEEGAVVRLDRETGDLQVLKDGEDITPADFTRVAANEMRSNFLGKLNEVHNERLLEEYGDRIGEVITGIVQQAHRRMTIVDLGQVEALLPASEQAPGERYENGQRLKVYLLEIREPGRSGPALTVSRRHEGLLKGLFTLEVPEIYDGLVEIKAVAREAGLRSKVAVWSNEMGIDPVGACVGPRGSRVRAVVSELRNEKIDIIQWDPDPARFIAKALSPARVREVYLDEDDQQAEVIVPDDQLSLAIGREGQNARLAVKLTDWKIDIKPESQALDFEEEDEGWEPDEDSAMHRCRAVLSNGRRCANMALPGSLFCGIPSHQEQAKDFEEMVEG
ncbi:NusA: transcription termination factor NusA [Rubrobacter radiotolerans]|uniref:Transcription termination/antitermination protein NusA n=1 Tax=Rubrobacter radiotolerans TaxID=42256 RepID=A0A023X2Y6_RUBRA|nr:transcription termination factor NusA [Rubrobacter radiotolerans]AHY46698.1 NusA: transcription termination factor NusA [Rubrobacter radiotolerans]MDX5894105.1 transcription termination factor NusA [Rubrobacter radiotolerans]SMC05209.1 NusA antitermination factor [Rubrobacter radiotolerans DSM 5868]